MGMMIYNKCFRERNIKKITLQMIAYGRLVERAAVAYVIVEKSAPGGRACVKGGWRNSV